MFHSSTPAVVPVTFRRFARKGYSLFSCLGREVRIGRLSLPMLALSLPAMGHTLPTAESQSDSLSLREEPSPAIAPRAVCPTAPRLAADSVELPEATVTALSRRPGITPAALTRQALTLTQADIEAAPLRSINDLLKTSAALDLRQRGPYGMQTDLGLLGSTFDQVALLLNGIPLVNPQTGHNAADFPLSQLDVERIEVLQGSAARQVGSQAFAGAVNIITRQPTGASPAAGSADGATGASSFTPSGFALPSLALQGGSHGTFTADLRQAWRSKAKNFSTSLSANAARSDGHALHTDFRQHRLLWQTDLSLRRLSTQTLVALSHGRTGSAGFYAAAYPDQFEATRRILMAVQGQLHGAVPLRLRAAWLRSLDHYQLTRGQAAGENFHRSDALSLSLDASRRWWAGQTSLGAELRGEGIASTSLGRPLAPEECKPVRYHQGKLYTRSDHRTNLSAFFEHSVQLGRVSLSAGFMAQHNSAVGGGLRLYPGADVKWTATPALRLFASWERGLRLPTFTDLYYKSPTQLGNQGLRPEESATLRLGADLSLPRAGVEGQLALQGQRGHRMIDWVMHAPDDLYHAEAFSMRAQALTATLTLLPVRWWGEGSPLRRLRLDYAYVHQHRVRGPQDAPIFKSCYAMEPLRHSFCATLTLSPAHLLGEALGERLRADLSLRLRRREGGWVSQDQLVAYGRQALLSTRWSLRLVRHVSLTLDLDNLTATRYVDYGGVPQPGFTCLLGVRVN